MNIVLTGFMASGKTQISKQLAKILNLPLVDTDNEIEKRMNMTINDIFTKYGEKGFREIEHKVICDTASLKNTVISTGGGVVLNKDNMKELRKGGVIVNLAPDFSVIEERLNIARGTRPLLKNSDTESIRKRFNDRLPYYADCDIKIEVSNEHSAEYFAKIIAEKLKNII